MNKLEALKKQYEGDIKQIDDTTFTINGNIYKCYDDNELEDAARENIREIWEDLSEVDTEREAFLQRYGGIENFYNEEYINDFRIEDSDTFGDMSDYEIIDYLKENEYFVDVIPKEAFDTDKVVDYIYDTDGAHGLSRVDGKITRVDGGYNLIKEN